jgi:predicted transcriptional regulator YheO
MKKAVEPGRAAPAGRRRAVAREPAHEALPAAIASERKAVLEALNQVVPMLGAMVGAHIEVVLHDLTRPETSVMRIANGHISGRRAGSPVLSGPGNDKALAILAAGLEFAGPGEHIPVFPYPTLARDGRSLTSGTVMFRDASGCTYAALCVNADFNDIETARTLLARMIPDTSKLAETARAPLPDMETLMREIIDEAVRRFGKPVAAMNKAEKTAAVESMLERGLFIVKGGVERAAAALGVTRFTVYNYLDAVKAGRAAGAAAAGP